MTHIFLAAAILAAIPPSAQDIDGAVRTAMDKWQVPGLSIVIVHEGRVIHLQGYGVQALGAKAPVTPDTIFPLASCTKPFTATLLATLVDEGKLSWNDPVRKHLPYFRLKDPLASERATLRDLLCHRTGLAEHTLLWYRNPLSIEDRVRRLAFLEPSADFRSGFQYQTIAFGAAGLAGERAAGRPWAELIQSRVLRPLGMTSSSAVEPPFSKDLASPHLRGPDGIVKVMPRYDLTRPDPAGSLHATARDLAPFLQMQLNLGMHGTKPLVAPARILEMQQPNNVIPIDAFAAQLNPETVQISYGLGWIIQDYRGRKMILHGGAIDGFRAQLMMVPQLGLGIGILSNLDGSFCNFALANTIVDLFLGAPPRAWHDDILKVDRLDRRLEAERIAKFRRDRPVGVRPLRPLDEYVGQYDDDAYGTCQIVKGKDGLELKWGTIRCPLEHYKDHVFVANELPFRDAALEFGTGPDGSIAGLHVANRTFLRRR